jgi:hypothetical protein
MMQKSTTFTTIFRVKKVLLCVNFSLKLGGGVGFSRGL